MPTPVLNSALTFFCLLGLGLSIYAYVVELKAHSDKEYEAMCDISEHMSCTKAFLSPYGKGFGIIPEGSFLHKPNSLLGMMFYSISAVLALSNSKLVTKALFFSVILSNFASIYFAFILAFILHDFCIVCVSTYVVNFSCLILSYWKLCKLSSGEVSVKKKTK